MARVNYPDLSTVMGGSKECPFVILNKVGRRGRRKTTGRMKAEIKRLQGLQSKCRFAVVQCPLCHEFKIFERGTKYARCPYCLGRFWLFGLPPVATSDDHGEVARQLADARRRYLKSIVGW